MGKINDIDKYMAERTLHVDEKKIRQRKFSKKGKST